MCRYTCLLYNLCYIGELENKSELYKITVFLIEVIKFIALKVEAIVF